MFRALACAAPAVAVLCCVCVPAFGQSITFLPPQTYTEGDDPRSAAFGDFNGDGRIDVIASNTAGSGFGEYTLSIFLNSGGGRFALSSMIPMDPSPYYITAADFNNDSKPDVAVAHVSLGKLSILLGNGNGTFSAPEAVVTSGLPFSVIAAHLNGDNNIDLVATHYLQSRTVNGGFVQVLLGNGNGTFTSAGSYRYDVAAHYSVVADFNGDSRPDIATTIGSSVGILLGKGDGTFTRAPNVPDVGEYGIVAADFNRDGAQDIAAQKFENNTNTHYIAVALGNGNGTFQPTVAYATGPWPWGLTVADFNLDGWFDLVSANHGSSSISVLQGNGNGTFQAPMHITVPGSPYFAGVSDFNGDSIPDLAVSGGALSILMNNAVPPGSSWNTPVNALAGQNSLTKFGGCDGCFDAGASTRLIAESGNVVAEFSFPEPNGFRLVGLAHSFSLTNGDSVDFGLRTQGGYVEVREGGAYRSDISLEAGAVFRISVQDGVVTYSKNGAVFYTSSGAVQYPLVFGAILGTANSAVQGVTFSRSDAPPPPPPAPPPPPPGSGPATWSSSSNVSFDGNTVRKSGGCDGCFDAFVQSQQTIGSSGFAEFTINDPAPFLLAGLAHAFTPGSAASIDFGIRIQGGYAEVRETGIYRSDIAAQPGAVFRISISGGVVSYSKDGFVFYSAPASAGSSTFGVLLGSSNASISNVVISNGS
jgi:hypothetical protein